MKGLVDYDQRCAGQKLHWLIFNPGCTSEALNGTFNNMGTWISLQTAESLWPEYVSYMCLHVYLKLPDMWAALIPLGLQ